MPGSVIALRKMVIKPKRPSLGGFHPDNITSNSSPCESLIAVILSTRIALLLVEVGLQLFSTVIPGGLQVPYRQVWFILLILIIITGTTVVAGSYPALILSSFKPVRALKGRVQASSIESRIRPVLVTLQFIFSAVLLIGTLAIYLQIQYIQQKNLGLDRHHVISFTTDPSINQHFSGFKQSLLLKPSHVERKIHFLWKALQMIPIGQGKKKGTIANLI